MQPTTSYSPGLSARPAEVSAKSTSALPDFDWRQGTVWDRKTLHLTRNLAHNWKAVREWSPQTWTARFGNRVVDAYMDLPGTGVSFPQDQESYRKQLSLGEFLKQMLVTPPERPCYVAYQRLDAILNELTSDYDFSTITGTRPDDDTDTRIWVGSAGTRSMLHSDLKPNAYVQVWGRKQVWIVPYEQTHLVYPFLDNIVNSQVDIDDVDLSKFPRFAEASLSTAVLEPGDVLFIPRGTWHYFKSLEPSISLNHWVGAGITANEYLGILGRLGPRYWLQTARDFVRHGLLKKPHSTTFFFSPPPTGKRLYDLVRHGDFSLSSDPAKKTSDTHQGG